MSPVLRPAQDQGTLPSCEVSPPTGVGRQVCHPPDRPHWPSLEGSAGGPAEVLRPAHWFPSWGEAGGPPGCWGESDYLVPWHLPPPGLSCSGQWAEPTACLLSGELSPGLCPGQPLPDASCSVISSKCHLGSVLPSCQSRGSECTRCLSVRVSVCVCVRVHMCGGQVGWESPWFGGPS